MALQIDRLGQEIFAGIEAEFQENSALALREIRARGREVRITREQVTNVSLGIGRLIDQLA